MKQFDLIVIGWGKAGRTLAEQAVTYGETVAIIEQDHSMIGGTCVNAGCIPSKFLVTNAGRGNYISQPTFPEKDHYYQQTIKQKNLLIAKLRNKMFHKLADKKQVQIFQGVAEFVSPKEVKINGKNDSEVITGRRIIINTGSKPHLPKIEGLTSSSKVITSRAMLDQQTLPQRLLIIGGGYISLEFASIYSSFGSQVTIVQHSQDFLPCEDQDLSQEIRSVLEKHGVKIITGVHPVFIEDREDAVVLTGTDSVGKAFVLESDLILIATGRRPNISSLHLEKAGISLNAQGGIVVDGYLRTQAPNIWAVGDVVGGLQFTYISFDDARIVAPQLFGGDFSYSQQKRGHIPYSVFIDPPYSRIGLNEKEAKTQNLNYQVVKIFSSVIPKANILGKTEGVLKALIDSQTGKILGVMLFCAESHELINLIKITMDAELPYSVLKNAIFTHPTMSESFNDLFNI